MFTFAHIATWIIVGLIGGSLAGLIVKRQKAGFGVAANLAVGCLGAIVGGALFWLFNLFPSLDTIEISLRDILAAVVGSLVVLVALWAWRRGKPNA